MQDYGSIGERGTSHPYLCESCFDQHDDSNIILRPSTYSGCGSRNSDCHTFPKFPNAAKQIRNQSVSLPYLSSGCEAARSFMSLKSAESTGHIPNSHCDGSIESVTFSSAEGKISPKRFWGFSARQFKCGIALSLLSIVDVMGFSIFSPFFPVVAERKNMSEVQIGLVFAAFSMAGIFASIATGTLLVQLGAKFIILSGMFWSAGATVCFGLLDRVPEEHFFWLCLLCRVFMGIGSLSAFTALFAVIFQEFRDRSLTVIGVTESLCSLGGIVGPLIGGGLYDVGGFLLPFAFLGGVQVFVLGACAFLIPHVAVERQANTVSPAWLLLNLHGLFSALFVIASFTVNAFIIANLSLFLIHSFQLTAFMVGVFMLIFSIFYGISTPVWGYISESRNIGAHTMTVSCFLAGIVLSFFGPADFWMKLFGWEEPQKWLVIVCISILGILMGGLIMPTFGEMIVAAKQMKLQDNELAQYGLVSGLWNTMFSIGDIIGPTLGGAISAKLHFNNTMAIFGAVLIGLAMIKTVHLIYLQFKTGSLPNGAESNNNDDNVEERTGLLRSENASIQA